MVWVGKRKRRREGGRVRGKGDLQCVEELLYEHLLEREGKGGGREGMEGDRVRGVMAMTVVCWASAVHCRLCLW